MAAVFPQIIVGLVLMGIVAIGAVAMRFWARRSLRAELRFDDWFAVLSLLFMLADYGKIIYAANNGSGIYDKSQFTEPEQVAARMGSFVCIILDTFGMSAARFSLLCLYHRLFSVKARFAMATKIMAAVSIMWFLGALFTYVFRCGPPHLTWDESPEAPGGRCLDFGKVFIVLETLNCAINAIISCMPIPIVAKLRLPLHEKVYISCTFAISGFVCITSALRVAAVTYHHETAPNKFSSICYWLAFQLAFAIIGICLPTYRPLVPKDLLERSRIKSIYSSAQSWSRRSMQPGSRASKTLSAMSSNPRVLNHGHHSSVASTGTFDKEDDVRVFVHEIESEKKLRDIHSVTVRTEIDVDVSSFKDGDSGHEDLAVKGLA